MMHISWLQAECSFLKAQIATVSNTQQKIRNIGSGYSISNQKIKKDIESLKLENKSLRERIKHLRR
jgi:cell division protein FtsB